MKALAVRIGPNRVAAILIGCALGLEILRLKALAGNTVGTIVCTLGEVMFLAAAAAVFVGARRASRRG